MAKLTTCKACGKEVSKSAKKCPHCGHKLKMGFMAKAGIGIAALILIVIIASMGGEDDTPTDTATDNKAGETTKAPKELSAEGVSSDVGIKVLGMDTAQEVGGQYTKETAQGTFKIVKVAITNNQKDAITVDANSFKLVDDQDREFTYSTNAQTAMDMETGNMDFFLKQLNPGLTQEGTIVFDVPADAKGFVLKARGGFTGKEITLKVE